VHSWQLGSSRHLRQFIFRYFDEPFVVAANGVDLKFTVSVHDLSPIQSQRGLSVEPSGPWPLR
jgi:hypothetical protein